jgi:hypothetical protein
VIYDDKKKDEMLRDILKKADNAYKMLAGEDGGSEDIVRRYITNAIMKLQYKFKHQCFSSEQEFRIVVYRAEKKPDNCKDEITPVHYRAQKGSIIPYLELESDINYLMEIKISPFLQGYNRERILERYAQQCKREKIIISQSLLPVRH